MKPYDLEEVLARITPAVLALLQDGVPRSRRAIVAALADLYPRQDVTRTVMRLAFTGRLVAIGQKYGLAPAEADEQS
jgi:hypothetical protein